MTPTTLLWLVTGCLMLQPLSTDLYLASLPNLASNFSVTPAAVQQTLSLFVIGFGFAQLISGPLSDRFGRRPVLIGGLSVYVITSMACALSPSLNLLIGARFIQAIGSCTAVVVARAVIRDAYNPAEGARVLAKASSWLALAPILGPILGGYLQVAFGWRAAFFALTFCGVAVWVYAWLYMKESNNTPNPDAIRFATMARNYLNIMSIPAFWAYTLPGAISYASIFVYISGTPFIYITVLDVPTEYYGYLYALGVAGYLSGTLICRRYIGRLGIQRTLIMGTVVALVGASSFLGLVLLDVRHWTLVVAAQFLVMGGHGINFPCAQSGSLAPFPLQSGAAAGLFGCITMVAALLAGTWVGSSHDGTLIPLAYISTTVALVVFAVARLLARYGKVA